MAIGTEPDISELDPQLRADPVWIAVDLIAQRGESARGGLNIVHMRSVILAGWETGISPIRSLYQAGISWDALNIFVWASVQGIEVVDLGQYQIDRAIMGSFSLDKVKALHVLPLVMSEDGHSMTVAVSNLNNMEALKELPLHFPNVEIHIVLAEPKDIDGVVESLQHEDAGAELSYLVAGMESDLVKIELDTDDDSESDAGIIQLMRQFVEQALSSRASDIHIDPTATNSLVRMRVDGVLQVLSRQDIRLHPQITNYIKAKARLDIANQRIPQDGSYTIRTAREGQVQLRVATMPTYHRLADISLEKVTLRVIANDESLTSLESLGLREDSMAWVRQCFTATSGMIVVAGPTGSGKTTTLYSAIKMISDETRNIMTIEDPIERRLAGVNQTQVNMKAGMGYPQALKGFLRHDPDVLLVGEIRADTETVRTAMEAAMTGRLVLTSTHTSSSAEVPTRMLLMGVEPFMVSSALRAVISQRLLRTLCPRCKEGYSAPGVISSVEWPDVVDAPEKLYRPVGCTWCKRTGYRGRAAIAEILNIEEGIEDLICSRVPTREIHDYAVKLGMRPLFQDALIRVAEGTTTLEEAGRILA